MGFMTRNVNNNRGKSGSNTTVASYGPFAVGDLAELLMRFDASLASSDASTPSGTLTMYHSTGDATYLQVSDSEPYAYAVWSKVYTGAAGGGATTEGSTESFGAGMQNAICFGAYIWFEFVMNNPNQTFSSANFDLWGK